MLFGKTSFEWHALPFGQAGMKLYYIFHISKGINTVGLPQICFVSLHVSNLGVRC